MRDRGTTHIVEATITARPEGASRAIAPEGKAPGRAPRPPLKQAFRALRNPNYRLFWFGQVISMVGTWMQRIGQAWLVLRLTNSPLALGIVTACQTLPVLLLALFGGVIADRMPKRRVLVITQGIMLVQASVLAVLTAGGWIHLIDLYLLAAVLGTGVPYGFAGMVVAGREGSNRLRHG